MKKVALFIGVAAVLAIAAPKNRPTVIPVRPKAAPEVPPEVVAVQSTLPDASKPPCDRRVDRLAFESSQDALLRALETERDEAVVLGILYRLGAVGDERAAEALEEHGRSADGFHAAAAIGALHDIAKRTRLEDVLALATKLADEALSLENADPIFPIAAAIHGVELETFVKGLAERGHIQAQQWMAQKTPFSEPCGRRNP